MKKKNPKIPEDLVYKFWRKYEEADLLKRDELLKPVIKNFLPIAKIKEDKLRQHVLKTYLRGYFDDLIEYFYSKENKR